MSERNTRVLLVEDDPGLRETLADILRATGMEVDIAFDAPAAFGLLTGSRYDVAIVDLVLPGPSGVEVIREIKSSSSASHVFAHTAYQTSGLLAEAQALGVDQTVFKPADPASLIALINKLVGSDPGGQRLETPKPKERTDSTP
jgi:DNA-binding response OmpR family regulator